MPCMGDDFDPDRPGKMLTQLRDGMRRHQWLGRIIVVRGTYDVFKQMDLWCADQFGEGGSEYRPWEHDLRWARRVLDDDAPWHRGDYAFAFRTEADTLHYLLRWSDVVETQEVERYSATSSRIARTPRKKR